MPSSGKFSGGDNCASPLGWTTFYKKLGVKPLDLLYPVACRLQVPK